MFTDIVGSTNLAEALGDQAWERLLRWHDDMLRKLVASGGGEIVNSTGDGFFVAFDSARLRRRLCRSRSSEPWSTIGTARGFALSVRIGLHTAEANRRGSDYSGTAVHVAARVAALAGGGRDPRDRRDPRRSLRCPDLGCPVALVKGVTAPVDVAESPGPSDRQAASTGAVTPRRIVSAMAKAVDKDESLKRLGGGRWQTRDERFTIEPQSGTWVVVDAEQTDDLGLPLVRGPFGSLGAAKTAIEGARGAEPAASPLAAKLRDRPAAKSDTDEDRPRKTAAPASKGTDGTASPASPAKSTKAAKPAKPEPPAEPRWMQALEPADRRRAKRLIDALEDAGASDPEGIARRDIVGEVPAAAAFAIARAIKALGDDASPVEVARLLGGGRDEDLGVRLAAGRRRGPPDHARSRGMSGWMNSSPRRRWPGSWADRRGRSAT